MDAIERISELRKIAVRGQIPLKKIERQFDRTRSEFIRANSKYLDLKKEREKCERAEEKAKNEMEALKKEMEDLRDTIRDADHSNASAIKKRKSDTLYVIDGVEFIKTEDGLVSKKDLNSAKTMTMSEAVEECNEDSNEDGDELDGLLNL